jgi:hypothetical protein
MAAQEYMANPAYNSGSTGLYSSLPQTVTQAAHDNLASLS